MLHEQIHSAVIDDEAIPWIPFAPHAQHAQLKYFKLDPTRGEMIVLLKAPAGTQLPRHHHCGPVIVYTIEGRWKYKEQDWIAGPGSVVFGTAACSRTPQVLPGGSDVLALNIIAGDLIFFDDQDQVTAIENWKTALSRYLAHCESAAITPKDLTAFS